MIFKCSVDIFVNVDSEAAACDCIGETLRDHLQLYAPESAIVDWCWQYDSDGQDVGGPVLATEREIERFETGDIAAAPVES